MKIRPTRLRGLLPVLVIGAIGAGLASTASAQDFDAVLAAPDDIPLNLAFARQEVANGNLSVAASTLERILIQDPNRHSDRLFYAVVLYRLGDYQGARAELLRLEDVSLSPLERSEANRYLRLVTVKSSDRSYSGRVTVGAVYEEDAAGAYFTAFDILGTPPKEEGTSSEVSLAIQGRAGLGSGKAWEVYGSALAYDRSRMSGAGVDFQRFEAESGIGYRSRLSTYRVGAFVRQIRLEGDPQLTEVGLRAMGNWRVTNATTVTARAEAASQNFDEPSIDAVSAIIGGDRDGERFSVGVSVAHRITARTTLSGGVDYEIKTASYDPFGYAGPRLWLSLDQRFRKGVYVLGSGSVRWIDYDEADPFFLLGAKREDTRSNARLAVGAPLSAFSARGATGDVREDIAIEGAVSYASRKSGSPLADFEGWGAEVRLIWRFGARN